MICVVFRLRIDTNHMLHVSLISHLLFVPFSLKFLQNEAIVDVTRFLSVHLSPYIDFEGLGSPLAPVLFMFVFVGPIVVNTVN